MSQGSSAQSLKIFVGGFTVDTTESDLRAHFSPLGGITDVVVIRSKPNNISKGYGFITAQDRETYERILHSRQELNGRVLDCFPGFKKAGHPELFQNLCDRKIFVGGFSADTADQDLWAHFSPFGPVQKAYVIRDPHNHRSRKFGFVIMQKKEDADRVLEAKPHLLKGLAVTIKRFTKEEDFKHQKQLQKLAAEKGQPGPAEKGQGGRRLSPQQAPAKEGLEKTGDSQPVQLATLSQEMTATHHTRSRRNSLARACSEGLRAALQEATPALFTCELNLRFNMCVDPRFYRRLSRNFVRTQSRCPPVNASQG